MIKLMRNFLWGDVEGSRKLVWVAWTKICMPKENGGLGVRNLRTTNRALLIKWIWRYSRSKHSLWRKIIHQKFKRNSELLVPDVDNHPQCRSLWKNVVNLVPEVQKIARFTVRNGKGIRFWKDTWLNRGCLQELFPVVFQAVRDKDATISDVLSVNGWNCAFKKNLDVNEQLEWDLLKRDLSILPTLVEEDDEIINFSTQRCYNILAGDFEACSFEHHLWKSNIPHKVSFILWATFHNSLPTRDMLIHRGVDIESDLCPLCNTEKESADHMFVHCAYSFEIWDYFIKAFKISWPMPANLLQLFDAWHTNVLSGRARKVWTIIHYAICWMLWKERSARVFNARHRCASEIIDHVKMLVVLWSSDLDTFKYVDSNLIWSNLSSLMSA